MAVDYRGHWPFTTILQNCAPDVTFKKLHFMKLEDVLFQIIPNSFGALMCWTWANIHLVNPRTFNHGMKVLDRDAQSVPCTVPSEVQGLYSKAQFTLTQVRETSDHRRPRQTIRALTHASVNQISIISTSIRGASVCHFTSSSRVKEGVN